MALCLGVALLAASSAAWAQDEASFRWRESVRCGPAGTLRFDAGAELVLSDPEEGRFEFEGTARENSRRREEYVITLTFIDWDDEVLFRVASEPFVMEQGGRSDFRIFGDDPLIADFWDDIAAVELDAEVSGEPLFEEAFDFYDGVVRYRGEQELEARVFEEF